jgi:hypothetical protein
MVRSYPASIAIWTSPDDYYTGLGSTSAEEFMRLTILFMCFFAANTGVASPEYQMEREIINFTDGVLNPWMFSKITDQIKNLNIDDNVVSHSGWFFGCYFKKPERGELKRMDCTLGGEYANGFVGTHASYRALAKICDGRYPHRESMCFESATVTFWLYNYQTHDRYGNIDECVYEIRQTVSGYMDPISVEQAKLKIQLKNYSTGVGVAAFPLPTLPKISVPPAREKGRCP